MGREDFGEIQFLMPVNLVDIDLDNLVEIEKGKIQVYGLEGQAKAPALGTGINQPSMLVFRYHSLVPKIKEYHALFQGFDKSRTFGQPL